MELRERYELLPSVLLPWYEVNKRDLPWRKDREPYHIWVSEIMLQQTRVEAVKGYYSRFLDAVPNVEALSKIDDDQLMKLWEGLGYYSRARNMKKAACEIMEKYGGRFPDKYDEVLSLPGIGAYTAGAICSIAYDRKTPAVDGNVLRVIARITDDDSPIDQTSFKRTVNENLTAIYPEQSGAFTQSLMELGATVCGPNRTPDCANCPCRSFCLGCLRKTADKLPTKSPKKIRRVQEMTVFILCADGRYALEKRPNRGLLASLWQFPNVPGKLSTADSVALVENKGLKPKEIKRKVEKKHVFTHVEWDMCGVFMEIENASDDYAWMTAAQINEEAALPTAFRQFWEETNYV